MSSDKSEKYYFDKRKSEYVYVSKAFGGSGEYNLEKRFIHKVFEKEEDSKIERVDVEGEYVLRCSPKGREQVRIMLLQDQQNLKSVVLQKFIGNKPQPLSFTFRENELTEFLEFLNKTDYLDLSNKNRFRIHKDKIDVNKELVSSKEKEIIEALKSVEGSERENFLESLRKAELSQSDLNILSGRKKALDTFQEHLFGESEWNEKEWQKFFENNTWIFGYGLDYKFMKILQEESNVSDVDLDGRENVITDYLMGTNKFTVLVELKKPTTPLFSKQKNRSKSWKLSSDLTTAVSQILTQKAEWQLKSERTQFDKEDKPISQKTRDPKTILVIGRSDEFDGNDRTSDTKAKTFELFRRNSRNIDILTYTELYERAYYIVNQKQPTY